MNQPVTDYPQFDATGPARTRRTPTAWIPPLLLALLLTGGAAYAQERPAIRLAPETLQPALTAPQVVARPTLTLTAAPSPATVGAPVRFQARWDRAVSGALLYKLLINGRPVAQWTEGDSHDHRFDQPGGYKVQVTAQRPTQTSSRATTVGSNVIGLQVLPELSVRIIPPALPVTAGEPAVFTAQVSPEGQVRYRWQGPDGQRSGSREFRVDTRALAARRHAIGLQVVDEFKRTASARSFLQIAPAYRPPAARITPGTLTVTQGEEAVFRAVDESDPRLTVRRRWTGPAEPGGDTDRYVIPTGDLAPRSYAIGYALRDSQGRVAEAQARLTVRPANYRQPRVSLEPRTVTLTQGQEVVFRGSARTDPRLRIERQRWEGPLGRRDHGDRYPLSSRDLTPGTYTIRYQVWDSQGQSAEATARLRVDPLPGLAVAVVPAEQQLLPGQQVRFRVQVRDPQDRRHSYRWDGPGNADTRGDSFTVTAGRALLGEHRISVRVSDDLQRSATATARLRVIAPELTLLGAPDGGIRVGDQLQLSAQVHPPVALQDLRLHTSAGDPGRPIAADRPVVLAFAAPGDYRVHLTARVADLPLRSDPRWVQVIAPTPSAARPAAPTAPVTPPPAIRPARLPPPPTPPPPPPAPAPASPPWTPLLVALVVLGGLGWWFKRGSVRPAPRTAAPQCRIAVRVRPMLDRWQGEYHNPPDLTPGVRLALVVDLGEQRWHDGPAPRTDDRETDDGQPQTDTG